MYDFYPEWGPARHWDEEQERPTRRARYWQPRQAELVGAGVRPGAPEARDAEGDRPDDN
jgi:hypothetical protein